MIRMDIYETHIVVWDLHETAGATNFVPIAVLCLLLIYHDELKEPSVPCL